MSGVSPPIKTTVVLIGSSGDVNRGSEMNVACVSLPALCMSNKYLLVCQECRLLLHMLLLLPAVSNVLCQLPLIIHVCFASCRVKLTPLTQRGNNVNTIAHLGIPLNGEGEERLSVFLES